MINVGIEGCRVTRDDIDTSRMGSTPRTCRYWWIMVENICERLLGVTCPGNWVPTVLSRRNDIDEGLRNVDECQIDFADSSTGSGGVVLHNRDGPMCREDS